MNKQPLWSQKPHYEEQPSSQLEWTQQVPSHYQQLPETQFAPVPSDLLSQTEHTIPSSSSIDYGASPYSNYLYDRHQKIFEPYQMKSILRVIRAIFYFVIAVPIAAFGLLGVFTQISLKPLISGIGLFFTLGWLVTSIAIFYRVRFRVRRFRSAQFIWWVLGTLAGILMSLTIAYAFSQINYHFSEILACCFILLGGLGLAVIALW